MCEWQETEYGKVPTNWNLISASEYCKKVTDGTHDSPKRQDEGNFLITSKHIKGRNIDFENAYLISKDDFCKINERSKVDQWDVIISMIGEYCGFAYLERNSNINYAIKNVGLFKTDDKNNAIWLYYYIQSKIGNYYLQTNKSGTSQPYITLGTLRELPILVPSNIEEQKAIASVLSSLDDKIDLLHRQNQTLEAMAETLFRQWFVEEADEGWEEKPLSSIAKHKKVNVRPDQNPETIYYHYSIPSFDDGKHPIKELGSEIKSNKYQVLANSILISKLNPRFPRVWAVDELLDVNSICSTEFQVVLPDKSEYYAFIYFFLKSKQVTDELIGAAGGTSGSHQRVKPADILNLTFQMSPQQKIDDFNLITSKNLKKITNNMKQIRTLEKMRDMLLPKLMSGEVRVELKQQEAVV